MENAENKRVKKTILLILVILICAGGVLVFLKTKKDVSKGKKNPELFTVKRDELIISVTQSGEIEALNSTDVKSEVEGRTTIISMVDEGTIVTANDVNNEKVLVELDSSDIERGLIQREIGFLNSQANYSEAMELLEIQKQDNQSNLQKGQMKVRFALLDLKKYLGDAVAEKYINAINDANSLEVDTVVYLEEPALGGEALKKLKELSDSIFIARSKLERASDKLGWTKKLYEKEYVAETDLKADELDVQSLEVKKEKADIELDLFKRYEFAKEVETKYNAYDEALRDLRKIEAQARSELAKKEARLESNKANYELQTQELEKAKEQLEACTIKAIVPGQVVYGKKERGWPKVSLSVGDEIRKRQTIIQIPDPIQMKVKIKVHESWIDKVKPDQKAKITVSAFPDEKFAGNVIKKAPLADQTNWLNPDLKVYATEVCIDGTHDFLKPGMTAKVEIIIDKLEDVLIVPVQAVVNKEGKKVCYIKNSSGDTLECEVETGQFNDSFVEITKGLTKGDRVLLNPPRTYEQTTER
jgi:RND family efflux transporter MFP subunit